MMKMIFYLMAVIMLITACDKNSDAAPPVTDIDGNTYDTVKINDQFWMQQNLKTSHYRNGDPIPEITSLSVWYSLTSGAWCWYQNDSIKYAATYGKLYNWYAVIDPRGLAPAGWHVPVDVEWTALSASLGGELVAGRQMKETGTAHWSPQNNAGASNSSGFTGLPGGYCDSYGAFSNIGEVGYWWSATEQNMFTALYRSLSNNEDGIFRYNEDKRSGFSVRCLRD